MYRKVVGDILAEIPGVEVVGTANNGKVALSRIAALEPDLITLDVEMPVMDGLETLREIEKSYPDLGVIMLSTPNGGPPLRRSPTPSGWPNWPPPRPRPPTRPP